MHKIIAYIPERKRFRNRWLGHLENSQTPWHSIDGVLYPVSGEHMGARYKELLLLSEVSNP